jgi:hypothetical protein
MRSQAKHAYSLARWHAFRLKNEQKGKKWRQSYKSSAFAGLCITVHARLRAHWFFKRADCKCCQKTQLVEVYVWPCRAHTIGMTCARDSSDIYSDICAIVRQSD